MRENHFPGLNALTQFIQIGVIDLVQFSDPAYADIDLGNLVPGTQAYDAILCQVKDPLEGFDCFFSGGTEYTVLRNFRDQRVALGNHIQLALHLAYLFTGITLSQRRTRIRGWNTGNLIRRVDIYGVPIVISENLNGTIPLIP